MVVNHVTTNVGSVAPPATSGRSSTTEAAVWLSEEERATWRTLLSVHARLLSRLDAELHAAHDISLQDYEVLVHLSEVDGTCLRMAELAERLVVSPSGLTRRLDGMVRDGLVERQACLSDRRGMLAVLTPKGRAVLAAAAPTHIAGIRRLLFEPLDSKQLRQMTGSLQAIGEALVTPNRQTHEDMVKPARQTHVSSAR
jgi:DNA-binding MarR family transcriptional regulator